MPEHAEISYAELELIAEEANGEKNLNATCRDFCARLIAHIEHDSPAYAESLAGLLRMPHVLEAEDEAAA